MDYKNKSKEELLIDVYRLEVLNNKNKATINKLEDIITKIKDLVLKFKESSVFKKLFIAATILMEILTLINELNNDDAGTN